MITMEQYYISYKTDSIYMKKDSIFYRMLLIISDKKTSIWVKWKELDTKQITEIDKSNIQFEVNEKLQLLINDCNRANYLLKENCMSYDFKDLNKIANICLTYKACIIAKLYALHKICEIDLSEFKFKFHKEIIDTLELILQAEKLSKPQDVADLLETNVLALEFKLAQLKCNCELSKSKYKSKKTLHLFENLLPLLKNVVEKNKLQYLEKLI